MLSNRSPRRGACSLVSLLSLVAFAHAFAPAGAQGVPETTRGLSLESLAPEQTVLFVENRGQFPESERYRVQHADGALVFDDRGMLLENSDAKGGALRLSFAGGRDGVRAEGVDRLETKVHYFTSRDERDWRTNVPAFAGVRYSEVWPGIDLVFQGTGREVKYELRVLPHADPERIVLRYEGATALRLDPDGDLVVGVDGREVLRDSPPVAYQEFGGTRHPVEVAFALDPDEPAAFGFRLGAYDRSRELVIDPAYVVYCGYAGTNPNGLDGLAVDAAGASYVAGSVLVNQNPLDMDAFVLKVRPDGRKLDFVVYLGGPSYAFPSGGVTVDAQGFIYLTGEVDGHPSFPIKVGPDLTFNGPQGDTFVCKLSPDGSTIIYCGYIGGSSIDTARSMAVDGQGCLWVCGHSYSTDFPVIGIGGTRLVNPNGTVAKVSADGSKLLLAGYLSGALSLQGMAVDANGDAYVTGPTSVAAPAFPVTVGPDLTFNGGGFDAFIAKIDGGSGVLRYCGYIGGVGSDSGFDVDVDASGCAYVAGTTTSDERSFPLRGGPFLLPGPGMGRGFVTKVDPLGQALRYSGFIQGGHPLGIAVDATGTVSIAGYGGANFPARNGPNNGPVPAWAADAFVAKIPPSGVGLHYGGLIGGAMLDEARGVAIDGRGNLYAYGRTHSDETTFPIRVGPGRKYNGTTCTRCVQRPGWFVAKVAESAIIPTGTGKLGTPVTFTLFTSDDAGLPYQAGTSFGLGPTPLGGRPLGLAIDPLLALSTSAVLPGVFQAYAGVIGGSGTATATLNVPVIPALVGQSLHTAFVTFDAIHPLGIKSISDTASFRVVP